MEALNAFSKLYQVVKLGKFITAFPIHTSSFHFKFNPQWGSRKKNRNIKLKKLYLGEMADPEIEQILSPLRALVKEQGDLVRSLKSAGAPYIEVKKAVAELKARKKILEDKELSLSPNVTFDRARMEDLLKRRFFYDQSFAIYGGITGQYDFGPMGCAFKSNILQTWRQHFVMEEHMLEVDAVTLTPEPVLKASGHVDRFADLMVKDLKTGECFRLDHLIKAHLELVCADKKTSSQLKEHCEDIVVKLDGMNKDEMAELLKEFNIKSPLTGNDLTEPIEFNLMFSTQTGPSGQTKEFLRPETAQGIFVNFKNLLEFNEGKLPFAAAQIGHAFRNEISPRSGLIRVREFTMAEIEHFVDPENKKHPKFNSVRDTELILYSACNQMDGKAAEKKTIGKAVDEGLVANSTLGYFMARIQAFLIRCGVDPKRLRFRQHMNNEMAHYACDCWDAECLTSYGWIECVGCADRSAYDLTQHTAATKVKLTAVRNQPFRDIIEFTPSVIEPSFGIGRIMYAIFEHNFKMRENDEQRTYFALPAIVAPVKCSVLPLSRNDEFEPFIKLLSAALTKVNVSHKVDDSSGSIGRRYARTDEIAIPYGITIDFDTLKEPHSVTLRERDSMNQIRILLDEVATVVHNLSFNKDNWENVVKMYSNGPQAFEVTVDKNLIESKPDNVPKFASSASNNSMDKNKLDDLLKQRFFYNPSFEIYDVFNGKYDFGPMGCGIKSNLLENWKNHFVMEEQMLEIDSSILTLEPVLKASGHVDEFNDVMVQDLGNDEYFRVDHLVKQSLEQLCLNEKTSSETKTEYEDIIRKIRGMNREEIANILKKLDIRSPSTGNQLSEPVETNLMFATQIGPSGLIKGFLRPETAQGIFVNFKRLLEFNQGKLPFAAAQIGKVFRNEISPKSEILRVKEFTTAEIVHFMDPIEKEHPKFDSIKNTEIIVYPITHQKQGKPAESKKIAEAVEEGLVANGTIGYFMARTQIFLVKCGIIPERLRFRQHMDNERAHYATDCWVAECLTSYGWIECVACTDRSNYDLTQHSKATSVKLSAERRLTSPKEVSVTEAVPNKGKIGKTFKKDAAFIPKAFEKMQLEEIEDLDKKMNDEGKYILDIDGKKFTLEKDMVEVKKYQQIKHVEEFIPSVISLSFGVERLMYSILEQNFKVHDKEQNHYLSLPTSIVPIKCSILSTRKESESHEYIESITSSLSKLDISHKVEHRDISLEKLFLKTDQIAIPYSILVDSDTAKVPHTVILRERDSTTQIRIPIDDIASVVQKLLSNNDEFENVIKKYSLSLMNEISA
ncbi:glycine--tRNA ligase isoform X2 [Coccinella septempunctata]|uniref:glycine--tRNA ligase isoform X2 n=1 Tax=Coccinella septempunctata TaxID=41139 RepID=UPI001D076AE0|nr:glycine--tRNA ligase isoform X2 [Coccinella septempunctata]